MPGITGIIRRQPYEGAEKDLNLMIEAMRHEKFYCSGQYTNKALGICVGWVGHQGSFSDCLPIWNEQKDVCLIFCGETFNSKEDAESLKLRGHQFEAGNASYLVHLYEENGLEFVKKLNGWFSGILLDLRARRVILFNDRYGMNRIYFHQNDNEFIFASEAKALLKVRSALREIRRAGLADYLRLGLVVGDKTLFRDISLLPGAAAWSFEDSVTPKKHCYFHLSEWEEQPRIAHKEFCERFADTVTKIVPRYIAGPQPVALALTGGLDTRMIAAALHASRLSLPCYTFGGAWGELVDIRKARQIAAIWAQPHKAIKIDDTFFKKFHELAQRSVYLSDGTHHAFGAHDVYLNQIARQIAPIRLTGKFGSEIIRATRLIRWNKRHDNDFSHNGVRADTDLDHGPNHKHPLSSMAFEEIPWYQAGGVAVEQSQVTLRTPYLDNDLVKLMFRVDSQVRSGGQLQPRYIKETAPELSTILTNFGALGNGGPLAAKLRYPFYRARFKMEYYYLFATPHWFTRIDRKLEKLHLERFLAGREKFEGYRIWIKTSVADFVVQTLSNPNAYYVQFFDRKSVERMVACHLAGTHNYVEPINKVLTVELICSSLLKL